VGVSLDEDKQNKISALIFEISSLYSVKGMLESN
jgi:hypothetical protein